VTERTIRKFDSLCGLWNGSRDCPLWLLFVCLSAARLVRSGDEILFLRCEIPIRSDGGLRERWPARLHGHVGRVSVVARRARATNVSSPLRPTIAAHATLSRFICCSRYSLPSEHKGVGVGRDKVIRIHSTHRPTNRSYNRRPEDSTSATQVPSRGSPGTAIIQPRSASCSGTGYHAQANYIHGTPARAHIQLHSKARGGRHVS